jgi:chlorite dismutase
MPDNARPAGFPQNAPVIPTNRGVYALWAVFRRDPAHPFVEADGAAAELDQAIHVVTGTGVTVRGIYDVSGFKADTDLMIWMHGEDPRKLQQALRTLRRTHVFHGLIQHWNYMAVTRDAEFNKTHVPAFVQGKEPREWTCVYPFVRSHEWYLIREDARNRMLAEHGRAGHLFTEVLSNTMAAFALGDYEWIVPLESDDLTALVDLMRTLRYVDARLYVTQETPFFTGRRITSAEAAEVLL